MNKKLSFVIVLIFISILAMLLFIRAGKRPDAAFQTNLNATPMKFSDVKVVSVYESVTDDFLKIRNANEIAGIISETHTDYIHRGFFRYSSDVDNYEALKNNIAVIKSKNPNVIFGASLIVSEIASNERDALTEEFISEEKVSEMAFDPQKWGINYELDGKVLTKEDLHKIYTERAGKDLYLPDITNPEYQRFVLDIIKKEIDSGADAIWIDGFYLQADIIAEATGDTNHPGAKAAFEAYSKIVDDIRSYGNSKGRNIYVGSWGEAGRNNQTIEVNYPFAMPKLDFVTIGISHKEMRDRKPDEAYWDWKIKWAKKNFGNVPVIAVIDWAFDSNTALGIFSQNLTKEESNEALRNFDVFFKENGILFAYPVHGGWMGWEAGRTSFGKTRTYDSLAPEFDTYDIIKALAKDK